MNKLWLVVRREVLDRITRRGFLFALLSVPLVLVVIVTVSVLLGGEEPEETFVVGAVDQAGILVTASAGADERVDWRAFSSEADAAQALSAGEIRGYALIPPDYAQTLQVTWVHRGGLDRTVAAALGERLRAGLLADQPAEIARRALEGSETVVHLPNGREFTSGLTFEHLLPSLAGMALIALVFFSSGYLSDAVVDEKTNRTMEILVTSLSAGQLMSGKVLAIAIVTLLQFVTWLILGGLAVAVGGQGLGLEWLQGVRPDAGLLLLVAALVVPAYLFVAALMVAVMATVVEPRSGQQVMMALLICYILPLNLVLLLLGNVNDPLMVFLGLFPLTAPVVMPLRVTFTVVPAWQIVASVVIEWLCALGALWLAGRAVRLGFLRTGQTLDWRALLGRRRAAAVETRPAALAVERPRAAAAESRRVAKTLLVLGQEFRYTIRQPYFILALVGLPLLIFGQMWLITRSFADEDRASVAAGLAGVELQAPETELVAAEGYVDAGGLLRVIPPQVPAGQLVAYADEASAAAALADGEISSYTIISPDYLQSGALTVVRPIYNPMEPNGPSDALRWALLANLLDGDAALAARVWSPMALQVVAQEPSAEALAEASERAEDEARLTSMLIMLLLYAVIVMDAGLLLRSVSEEKKNRVIEILLGSLAPRQILAGKVLALGLVGLAQLAGWAVIGYALFGLIGMNFRLPVGFSLSVSTALWAAVFFLLGYAVYASLMAGAGALVPNWREASTVTFVLILPALVGFELSLLQDNPHSTLMVIGSLFPLTAPFVMFRRLLSGGIPLWQLALAAALLVATCWLIIRAVAGCFRAQYLLSGQSFSFKRFFGALLGR